MRRDYPVKTIAAVRAVAGDGGVAADFSDAEHDAVLARPGAVRR